MWAIGSLPEWLGAPPVPLDEQAQLAGVVALDP